MNEIFPFFGSRVGTIFSLRALQNSKYTKHFSNEKLLIRILDFFSCYIFCTFLHRIFGIFFIVLHGEKVISEKRIPRHESDSRR